jgi:Kef-type K+ transport system membrane component KefB
MQTLLDLPLFAFLLNTQGNYDATHLPLEMLLVFGAAKLMDEVFERLHQPGIVGQIIAGIILGPSILGWLQREHFLEQLAELGVMFLLFRVGLEVKSSELMRVGGTAAVVALLGVVVPFALGWGIMYMRGEPVVPSLFLGAAMVATSVGITAQVLASKGLLQVAASRIILAAAVIDDVLGLIVLAIVTSIARGRVNLAEILAIAGVAIGFTVLVAHFGTRTLRKVVPQVEQRLRAAEGQFALALVLLFALSLLAVYAGVAAIIGAFLAGMALAESVSHRVHDLAQGVTELLVPFFLVGIGLQFDLRAFANPSTMILAVLVLVAAVASKFIGCGLGALSLGKRDAIRIGVGMSPRGEVGMVVAQLGLGLNVISQNIYSVVVFMSVATTMIAPPLLKLAYKDLTAKMQPVEQDVYRLG